MPRTSTWSPAVGRPPSRWCTPSVASSTCPMPRSSRRCRRRRRARARGPTSTSSPRPPARACEIIGGAKRGKAIIILNPADPPMIMRDTIFCAIPEDADHDAITQSIKDVVAEVQTYVPGYRLLNEPQFDEPTVYNGGNHARHHVRRSGGCGRLPAAVRGKPGHHDRRGDQGRRGDRQGVSGCDRSRSASMSTTTSTSTRCGTSG